MMDGPEGLVLGSLPERLRGFYGPAKLSEEPVEVPPCGMSDCPSTRSRQHPGGWRTIRFGRGQSRGRGVGVGRPQGRFKGRPSRRRTWPGSCGRCRLGPPYASSLSGTRAGKSTWIGYRSGRTSRGTCSASGPRSRGGPTGPGGAAGVCCPPARTGPPCGLGSRVPAAGRSAAGQVLDLARQAPRQAEAGVAEAEEPVRVLVAVVAELRGNEVDGAASSGVQDDAA